VAAALILVAVLVVAVVAFNFLVMDLDVFWAKLGRKLGHLCFLTAAQVDVHTGESNGNAEKSAGQS
jgi:hypothetical protein